MPLRGSPGRSVSLAPPRRTFAMVETRAFYDAQRDFIRVPAIEKFRDPESYYATLAHETTHWTGHPTRLDRNLGRRFGSASYAMEELVAELGATFISADVGLVPPTRRAADYIAEWIQVLEKDPRAIFTAATRASQAADYLAGLTAARHEATAARVGTAYHPDRNAVDPATGEVVAAWTVGAGGDGDGADGEWVIPGGDAHRDGGWVIRNGHGDLVELEPGKGKGRCFRTRAQAEAAAARLDAAWQPTVGRIITGETQMTYQRSAVRDIVRGDELCWTEQVWTGPWRTPDLAGERTIEARVDSAVIVGESLDDRLGLTVSAASGVDAPAGGSLISRRTGDLAECGGVWRKEWADETKRDRRKEMDELVRQKSYRSESTKQLSAGIGS